MAAGISCQFDQKTGKFQIHPDEKNMNPYALKGIKDARVERKGMNSRVHDIHSSPISVSWLIIEELFVGRMRCIFHVTNLEQDWDVPHGFAVKGARTAETS